MRIEIRVLLAIVFCGYLLLAPALSSQAASFPDHPIRLIVPFAPGGGADSNARIVAEPWSKILGQPILVDNKGGAGGTLGAAWVAQAPHDGYTLLYATPGQQMTAPYLFKDLSYDPFKGLIPIGKLTAGNNVLLVNNSLPVHNVKELIDYARAHPGKLGFGSSGIGSTSHLAGELFKQKAGIDIFHVPYRGTGPARSDLLGGQIPMTIDTLSVYLPLIQAGRVRALGVSSLKRDPTLPDVPAIAETLPGFEAIPINYLAAPAGTPRAIIDKLNAALNQAISDLNASKSLAPGTMFEGSTPEEMTALITSEQQKWKDLIERANIKLD